MSQKATFIIIHRRTNFVTTHAHRRLIMPYHALSSTWASSREMHGRPPSHIAAARLAAMLERKAKRVATAMRLETCRVLGETMLRQFKCPRGLRQSACRGKARRQTCSRHPLTITKWILDKRLGLVGHVDSPKGTLSEDATGAHVRALPNLLPLHIEAKRRPLPLF